MERKNGNQIFVIPNGFAEMLILNPINILSELHTLLRRQLKGGEVQLDFEAKKLKKSKI